MEFEDFVGTSVALETSRRAFHSDEAVLAAQYKQGPVDELQTVNYIYKADSSSKSEAKHGGI